MKKRMEQCALLVATAVASIVITGCVKEIGVEPGTAIRFSAISSGLETRTVYGNLGTETIGGVSTNVQYIDWEENDGMTILMKYSDSYYHKNYIVDELSTSATNLSESTAIIEPDADDANPDLVWKGLGNHTFYAMYPTGTFDAINNKLTGIIPSTQAPDARLDYGYMFTDTPVTKNVAASKNVDKIDLYFNPHFTAFQFTLNNNSENPVSVTAFSLTSSPSGAALAGTLEYNVSNAAVSATPAASNAKVISISGSGFTIPAGESKVIVFTALPNTFASGTLTLSCTANNVVKNFTLNSGFVANKKHNLSVNWEEQTNDYFITVDSPEVMSYGTAITAPVSSYKTPKSGGGTHTDVAWSVQGYYSSAADAANTSVSNNTSKPSWLTINSTSQTSINYTVAAPDGEGTTVQSNIQNLINTSIASTSCGDVDNPVNLANPSNKGSDPSTYIDESANCYIVNHPGWYKIPLVMGNGVKANALAADAVYKGNTTNSGHLRLFYDYAGNPISSPILSSSAITSYSIIWQDAAVVSDLGFDASTSTVASTTVKWLKFQVTASCQGNAVISVKNNSKTIMWSYHIWVTDFVPGQDKMVKSGFYSSPYPLGWVTTSGNGKKWDGRSIYVRLRQGTSGKIAVLTIKGPDVYSVSEPAGFCPYYQWARKDPLPHNNTLNSSGEVKTSLQNIGHSGTYGGSSYLKSIVNPGKFIRNTAGTQSWWGGSTFPFNLWNANADANSYGDNVSNVTKTIFDPCPSGYLVPGTASYSGVSLSSVIDDVKHIDTNNISFAGSTYFWTAVTTSSSSGQAFSFSLADKANTNTTTELTYSSQRDGMCILPMRE